MKAIIKSMRLFQVRLFTSIFVLWAAVLILTPTSIAKIESLAYSLLGVTGAIFANSTGAGGGVIFVPMFHFMDLNEAQAIATSFGIQCFGMTAGAITWSIYYRGNKRQDLSWTPFTEVIVATTLTSIAGLWTAYGFDLYPPSSVYRIFSWFSILLGLLILASVFFLKKEESLNRLGRFDYLAILVIGYLGGMITAWLSVGVGEILAVYLILRRFEVAMAVAAAVVVSAFTVWSAAIEHLWLNNQHTMWEIIIFAGPGAIIGGVLARSLVSALAPLKFKTFFACWILLSGIAN